MIKNGKLFGKINVFDFALILLLIVLVFGITAKFIVAKREAGKSTDITYEVLVKSVRQETLDSFEIGQKIFEFNTTNCIGEIINITSEGATDLMETLDGKIIEAPVENRFNFTLTVKATAKQGKNGLLNIEKLKIFDGKDITFDTLLNRCQGTVQNIKRIENVK